MRVDSRVRAPIGSSRKSGAGTARLGCDCPWWKRAFCVTACERIDGELSAVEARETIEWFERMRNRNEP